MFIKKIKILYGIILFRIFKFGLRFKVIILPDRYSIPVSNILDLNKDKSWQKKSNLDGIKIDLINQLENIKKIILPFQEEYKNGKIYNEAFKLNAGPGYGVIEAQALHGVIRYYSPKKIIDMKPIWPTMLNSIDDDHNLELNSGRFDAVLTDLASANDYMATDQVSGASLTGSTFSGGPW